MMFPVVLSMGSARRVVQGSGARGGPPVKDEYGTPLAEGDTVALIKDLKLGSDSHVLKSGTKPNNIRLVGGDRGITCKIEGSAMVLKTCLVKKV